MHSEFPLIDQHQDIASRHRFGSVVYEGEPWDLSHLAPFVFRAALSDSLIVDVVVLFSCHCFAHGVESETRDVVPREEFFMDGTEVRILSPERYRLSKLYLPQLIHELSTRHIRVLGGSRPNYLTVEAFDEVGRSVNYAVFFEVLKDRARKKRMLLRVQSAYKLPTLNKRMEKARKVNFGVLLKAVYEGREIRS